MASRRLTDLGFEDWIEHVFSHPVARYRQPWHFDLDADLWDAPPALTAAHVTRLFEDPEPPLAYFADSQIAQGLEYLVSSGAGDHMSAFFDPRVPEDDRVRGLTSIGTLFARLFAVRCTPHLSHRDEPGAGVLNGICYMWWDMFPVTGAPADPMGRAAGDTILGVMDGMLALGCIACQESALHGLGHWHAAFPDTVPAIIDRFLARSGPLRPDLAAYARAARCGCVL